MPNEYGKPYAVVGVEELHEPLCWPDELNTYIVYFFLYSSSSTNPTELINGAELVKDAFDLAEFSVDNWELKHFKRERSTAPSKVDKMWSITIEYECILEEE
jgi:hypothetical protein